MLFGTEHLLSLAFYEWYIVGDYLTVISSKVETFDVLRFMAKSINLYVIVVHGRYSEGTDTDGIDSFFVCKLDFLVSVADIHDSRLL